MITDGTKYCADELLGYLIGRHLVGFSGTIIVAHQDNVLDKLSRGRVKMDAVMWPSAPATYTLIIRSNLRYPELALCHEFVHLCQYERGDLSLDRPGGSFIWKGVNYGATELNYEYRPWEMEALAMEGKYRREYRRYIKTKKNGSKL